MLTIDNDSFGLQFFGKPTCCRFPPISLSQGFTGDFLESKNDQMMRCHRRCPTPSLLSAEMGRSSTRDSLGRATHELAEPCLLRERSRETSFCGTEPEETWWVCSEALCQAELVHTDTASLGKSKLLPRFLWSFSAQVLGHASPVEGAAVRPELVVKPHVDLASTKANRLCQTRFGSIRSNRSGCVCLGRCPERAEGAEC